MSVIQPSSPAEQRQMLGPLMNEIHEEDEELQKLIQTSPLSSPTSQKSFTGNSQYYELLKVILQLSR